MKANSFTDCFTECSVADCDRNAKARGFCNKHYCRWYRNGDPLASKPYKGRPRTREGLPHLYLDAPSDTNYNRGCRCDDCKDCAHERRLKSRAKIARENEELWAHIAQIRERMSA